jgi:DNA-binding beta-propeller fold protein YncE
MTVQLRKLTIAGIASLTVLTGALACSTTPTLANELSELNSFGGANSKIPDPYPLMGPDSVAVNTTTGNVYVAEREGGAGARVQEFTAGGEFVLMFGWEVNKTKVQQREEGQPVTEAEENLCTASSHEECQQGYASKEVPGRLERPLGVAVNSTSGDIYVAEEFSMQEFDSEGRFVCALNGETGGCSPTQTGGFVAREVLGVAVDSHGTVYVAQSDLVQEFEPSGEIKFQFSAGTEDMEGKEYPFESIGQIAVEPAGNSLYLTNKNIYSETHIVKFNAHSGERQAQLAGNGETGHGSIAVDPVGGGFEDDLFVFQSIMEEVGPTGVVAYTPSGDPAGCVKALEAGCIRFAKGVVPLERGVGLAISPAYGGTFYLVDSQTGEVLAYGEPVVKPTAGVLAPDFLLPGAALLRGLVNPERGDTGYHFVYGPTNAYGTSVPLVDTDVGSGVEPRLVSQYVTGLQPGVTYHYAVVATNGAGTVQSADQQFTVPAVTPPEVLTGGVGAVAQSTATLMGNVNPEGVPTTYELDLGVDSDYGTRIFGELAPSSALDPVTVEVGNLAPDTTYHYRLVATNTYGTSYGGDQTFTTPGFPTSLIAAPMAPALIAVPAVKFPPEAPASTPATTPKSLTSAQKLSNALKGCKKKPKQQRATCEKQAHKKYGSAKKAGKSTSSRKKR